MVNEYGSLPLCERAMPKIALFLFLLPEFGGCVPMKRDTLNRMVYTVCRKKAEIDLSESCKNGSKYGPEHIKQVRDRLFF